MKLLFDQNLSRHLVAALQSEFPGSVHVQHVSLVEASDDVVWEYARQNGFTIVSKDADFHQKSFLHGHPPKVVWIRRGNCSTAEMENLLRQYRNDIFEFEKSEQGSFLALY